MGRSFTNANVGTTNWVMASKKLQSRAQQAAQGCPSLQRAVCKQAGGAQQAAPQSRPSVRPPPELRHQQRLLQRERQCLVRHARPRRPLHGQTACTQSPRHSSRHARHNRMHGWKAFARPHSSHRFCRSHTHWLTPSASNTFTATKSQGLAQQRKHPYTTTHVQHEEGCLVCRGDDHALLQRHLGAKVPRLHSRQAHPNPHGALRGQAAAARGRKQAGRPRATKRHKAGCIEAGATATCFHLVSRALHTAGPPLRHVGPPAASCGR